MCCSPWGCKESDMTELNWVLKHLILSTLVINEKHTYTVCPEWGFIAKQ